MFIYYQVDIAIIMKEREDDLIDKFTGQLYDQYEVIDVVGSGTFGKVYLVREHSTKQLFAMKHVLQNKKYKNRELDILQQTHHQNIVKLYKSFYMEEPQGTYLNLIMEYIPDTLSKIVRNKAANKQFLSDQQIIAYSRSLLQSLKYLHKNNICHRDIKPSNILVNGEVAKLCDFGSAKVLTAGQKNISYICSRYYRAPELLLGASFYTYQVDIWSLGCVIAEMMTNRSLFQGSNSTSMLVKIIKTLGSPSEEDMVEMMVDPSQIDIIQSQGQGVGQRLRKLNPNLKRMIVYNPKERITAEAALQLPFFS